MKVLIGILCILALAIACASTVSATDDGAPCPCLTDGERENCACPTCLACSERAKERRAERKAERKARKGGSAGLRGGSQGYSGTAYASSTVIYSGASSGFSGGASSGFSGSSSGFSGSSRVVYAAPPRRATYRAPSFGVSVGRFSMGFGSVCPNCP